MSTKKQFEPDFRDLPSAFLTVTKKGKSVYRIRLNTSEILDALERGNTVLSLDIPCDANGTIRTRTGKTKLGKTYKAFSFYGWAVPAKEEQVGSMSSI